jgi:hypothetical protein
MYAKAQPIDQEKKYSIIRFQLLPSIQIHVIIITILYKVLTSLLNTQYIEN